MTEARNEILNRLREAHRDAPGVPAWRSRRHFTDPAERFAETLAANKGEVFRAKDLEEALAQLAELIDTLDARRIVANKERPFDGFDSINDIKLEERWPDLEWRFPGGTEAEWRQHCATADLGISGATAALAETGTIVVSSGSGQSRLATLLPPVHIALVGLSVLTTDIFTWTAARQRTLTANVVLIGGPSKTADIEQTLSVGVHGPKRFIVILYDDSASDLAE